MKYSAMLASAICILAAAPMAQAQTEPKYNPPKTSWGAPDIGGMFSTASLTSMTRPAGASGLIVSNEEAAKLFNRNIYTRVAKEEAEDQQAVTTGKEKLALLTDANPDRAYNRYWMDPGADLGKINGQYRSSWIVEPANGQIPYLKAQTSRPNNIGDDEEQYADRASDNPEDRGNTERCVHFGSAGPVLRNGMYNNTLQIVQTPDHVMILGEMVHEVRVIKINGQHGPAAIPQWSGDSVGHFEGNTLVVETVNVEPRQGSLISLKGKVTERFTRANEHQVLYQYTVEDPTLYSQTWKGEMPLNVTNDKLYEYACLEGNYSMFNLLSGARAFEREGRKNGARKAIFAGVADTE